MQATSRSTSTALLAVGVALVALTVTALPIDGAEASAPTPRRAAGTNRLVTSVEVAGNGWARSDTVVVARSDDPADALAGSSLAGQLRAPLLITPGDALAATTAAEVRRLDATTAWVLGGPAALSDEVVQGLRDNGVRTVTRLAGPDRWATAAAIADELDTTPGGTALIVGGWPDALGVSGLAATKAASGTPWPVLLAATSVPKPTADALARIDPAEVIVAGGPAAVSDAVVDELERLGYAVRRVAGADRYDTSLKFAQLGGLVPPVLAATGANFPDGLSAGPLAARLGGTLLLVPRDRPPLGTLAWLHAGQTLPSLLVIGGTAAISDRTVGALWAALQGSDRAPTSTPSGSAVEVRPGDDLAAVVAAQPAGTTFVIAPGVHRLASTEVRAGDHFIGEDGAVLSGARDLTAGTVSWTASGGHWYVGGQTQEGEVDTSVPLADGGNARDRRPEELFVEDQRLLHVGSRSALGPGRWYFDYATDRIWIAQDPASLGRIETSVAPYALAGGEGTDDVTIENITFDKYASVTRRGAVDGRNASGWIVRNSTFRWNHGSGVVLGPASLLEGSLLFGNGQLGLRGIGEFLAGPRKGQRLPMTIAHNTFHSNAALDFKTSWEAGAMKITTAAGLVIVDNHVHDNPGSGIWVDVDSHDVVIASNLVERSSTQGMLYELSERAHIYWNTVLDNGDGSTAAINEAGIFVSNSADVEVSANLLRGNGSGVIARSAGNRDPLVSHLWVHHNDIQMTSGRSGLNIDNGDTTAAYTARNNRFTDNTYRLDSQEERRFFWGDDSAKNAAQWRALGQDVNGTFLGLSSPGQLPAGAVGFSPGAVGAS